MLPWQRIRVRYPTKSVYHMSWNRAFVYAVNWITYKRFCDENVEIFNLFDRLTDKIIGSNDDTANEEKCTCYSIVTPEDTVVNYSFID